VNRPDGSVRWLATHAEFLWDEKGEPVRFTGATMDITSSKEAIEARRLAEERLERSIRGTSDGPWEYDIVSDTYWLAPHWWQMLDYHGQEFTSKHQALLDLVHPEDVPARQAAFKQCIEGRGPYDCEFRVRMKS